MIRNKILIIILIFLALSMLFLFFNYQERYTIASFSTDLISRNSAQLDNIALALKEINNYKLKSGETFSFNQVVGERAGSEGFKPASTIHTGAVRDIPGGGICQLSSTLYNAALFANLKIIERFPHRCAVSSVPLGRDATVSYGSKDLVFQNPYGFCIKIKGRIVADRLNIEILAPKRIKQKISIQIERLSSERDKFQAVRVWRIVAAKDKEFKELISQDYYEK